MTPEERAEYEAQKARWTENSREFRELYERRVAVTRALAERRERRRQLIRRLIPFLHASLA